MKGKAKKIGYLVATILLLVLAIYINYKSNLKKNEELDNNNPSQEGNITISDASSENGSALSGSEFFEVFRADRESVRAKEIEYLDAIIQNDKTDSETLADAQAQKIEIVTLMEKEFTIETLLKSKGFEDVAVTFHTGSVNAVICAKALSDDQVAQILDIIKRETGEPADNIKISLKQ